MKSNSKFSLLVIAGAVALAMSGCKKDEVKMGDAPASVAASAASTVQAASEPATPFDVAQEWDKFKTEAEILINKANSQEEKAQIQQFVSQMESLVNQARGISDKPDDAQLLLANEYHDIANKARETDKIVATPELDVLYKKIKKDAPNLNIMAVSYSNYLPKNFVQVMALDEKHSKPHFSVYSITGEYFLFPGLSWGQSFFNKKGEPMEPQERMKVVKEFAQALEAIRNEELKGISAKNNGAFFDVSAGKPTSENKENVYLLTDLNCPNCFNAEKTFTESGVGFVQSSDSNQTDTIRSLNKYFVAIPHSGSEAEDAVDVSYIAVLNCDTTHPKGFINFNDATGKRNLLSGIENTQIDTEKVKQCYKQIDKVKILSYSFGVKPENLPLIVSSNGLQLSGSGATPTKINELLKLYLGYGK